MEFAIVRFTNELDAPGIISTCWIDSENNYCWYPGTRIEEKKHKLLISHAPPEKDWLKCPIRILRTFSTYQSARRHLREAEDTSNLESEVECSRPQSRKRKIIRFPGEDSSSSSEKDLFECNFLEEQYPSPPSSRKMSSFFSKIPDHNKSSPISTPTPSTSSTSKTIQTFKDTSLNSNLPSTFTTQVFSRIQELSDQNESNAKKLTNLWQMVEDVANTCKRLEEKFDMFVSNYDMEAKTVQDSEGQNLISSLPAGIQDFLQLNKKIEEDEDFRRRLVNTCMQVGGSNIKNLVCNLLRKLINDDIGEEYSLTGKQLKNYLAKKSFERTEVYKLITEICGRTYKEFNNNVLIREAISDWLMQAKFRKSRREKRLNEKRDRMLVL